MRRTQISLEDQDRALLDAQAEVTGQSISALIREAIRHSFGHTNSLNDDVAVITASAGAWNDRDMTGEQYVEGLRSGQRLTSIANVE